MMDFEELESAAEPKSAKKAKKGPRR